MAYVPLRALPRSDPGRPDLRTPTRFLVWIGRMQLPALALGVTWGVLWMGAQALIPGALGAGVQAIADDNESAVLRWSLVVLGLGVFQAGAGLLRHRAAVTNWISAASRVQQLIVRQAARLGGDLPRQVATGEVVAATANDVERIGSAFDVFARFAGAIVAFFGVAAILLTINAPLGTIVLVGVPVLSLAISPLVRPLERRERDQRVKLGLATELAADTVAGLRVLRGIGGEDLFLERYREASTEVRLAAVRTAQIRSLLDALQVLLPGVFVVAVTWLGARLAIDGRLSIGALVAFYGYTAFMVLPLRTVTETAHKWTAARVASQRVLTVLRLERTYAEDASAVSHVEPGTGGLVDAQSGLEALPGQLTAVVTDDPVTADTLADRLGRYSDGDVRLSGTRLSDLPIGVVRRRVLVQDKDPVILSGPAGDLFDIPRTGRVGVLEALSWASANDVVEALPEGLATDLPERGRSLSGGQRQRLALARSLVADPDVLVLDEPTSAVDTHTEARIGMGLRRARQGRTTVVFTTSPLLLEHADTVAFVQGGTVVANGRHRDLMKSTPAYRATVVRGVG
jgi:ABC-type multidrug transport system fused ATPase/permease subunit